MNLRSQCVALLTPVLLFVALAVPWAAAEEVKDLPAPTSYVSDFAGVIDPSSRASMEALGAEVLREAHATLEIVTVHSLNGEPIEDFATALEDKWRVGPKASDRGVLMIFAMDDHKRRIEVGSGLEGVLNDAKVGDIGRSMDGELKQGRYGPAMLEGEQAIANDIAADAGVTLTPLPPRQPRQQSGSRGGGGFGIIPIIFLFVVLYFLFRGGRGGRGGGGGGGLGWFLLGNLLGGGFGGSRGGGGFGGGDGGGGDGGGSDDGGFSGGFGGGSEGGGASGSW